MANAKDGPHAMRSMKDRYPHMGRLEIPAGTRAWDSEKALRIFEKAWSEELRIVVDADGSLDRARREPLRMALFLGVPEAFASMLGDVVHDFKKEGDYQFKDTTGSCVAIHHDAAVRKKLSGSTAISQIVRRLFANANSVVYLARNMDDVPAILQANCTPIHPRWDPLKVALKSLRAVSEGVDGLTFELPDGSATTDMSLVVDDEGRIVDGAERISFAVGEKDAMAIYVYAKKFLSDGRIPVRALLAISSWTDRGELAAIPVTDAPSSIAAIPGIAPVRDRLAKILHRVGKGSGERTGILLYGPPGTGKTMIARALARDSGRNFVSASFAEWQGSGSGHLGDCLGAMRASFQEARDCQPSILFIDELDSMGSREQKTAYDNYWRAVVNGFLELVQGFRGRGDVVLVGATNDKDVIDAAILRAGRFGEHIHIPRPGVDETGEIVDWYLDRHRERRGQVADGVRGADLAVRCLGVSPARIEALVSEAGHLASEAGEPLSSAHFETAIVILNNRGVLPRTMPKPSRSTAIHEAGHALALFATLGSDVRFVAATVVPGVDTRGQVSWRHVDEGEPSDVCHELSNVFCLLAGREAEVGCGELGNLRFGAVEDLKAARDICRRLARHGISPTGLGAFVDPENAEEVDKAANAWLVHVQGATSRFVREERERILRFADVLLERETIMGDDVADLIAATGLEIAGWLPKLLPDPAADDVPYPDTAARRAGGSGATRLLQEQTSEA